MSRKMLFSLVLLAFILADTLTISQETNRSTFVRKTREASHVCQTEEQTRGKCIGLIDCLPYITRLRKNPDDTAFIQFLQRSNRICQMPRPIVCCPHEENLNTTGSEIFLENRRVTDHLNSSNDRNYVLPTFENECGITKVNIRRIVGGEPAEKNAWPWMALIAYLDSSGTQSFRCGGSLITNRHVLTAAHCITGDERVVRLGEHNLTTDLETKHEDIDISRAARHPSYDTFDKHSDIGIIYLKHDVQFTDQIRAICLPVTSQLRNKNYIGYNPIAIGFGHTQRGGNSSAVLLQLQIPILDNNVCLLRYREQNALKSSKQFDSAVLCAGSVNGKDTCQGDSGGPLMVAEKIGRTHHFVLAGIVSNGRGCGAGIPGVYTRVQSFVDWIEGKVHEPV